MPLVLIRFKGHSNDLIWHHCWLPSVPAATARIHFRVGRFTGLWESDTGSAASCCRTQSEAGLPGSDL